VRAAEQVVILQLINRRVLPGRFWAISGPDGCACVVDYGAVRDKGPDTHFVGAANGPLVQIPGTGVIWKICPSP
jgi:hypothetical protein